MLRRALALAVPAGIMATKASAQTGDHRQAIDALIGKFAEAYNRKDADGIAALFTEDGILSAPAPILVPGMRVLRAPTTAPAPLRERTRMSRHARAPLCAWGFALTFLPAHHVGTLAVSARGARKTWR